MAVRARAASPHARRDHARVGVDGRELRRALDAVLRARLVDGQRRHAQVAVVLQRKFDQPAQGRISEEVFPSEAGRRSLGLRLRLRLRLRLGLRLRACALDVSRTRGPGIGHRLLGPLVGGLQRARRERKGNGRHDVPQGKEGSYLL